MPEVADTFPRVWVEFADPADNQQLIRADLTWLTSRWSCIFGSGCRGVVADRPDAGCCTHGAHFSDDDDRARVTQWARGLDATTWERFGEAQAHGFVEQDEDGADKTRVVDGACIFFNSRGFPGGYGCALHHLAERRSVSFVATKPDVCWQLPLRRDYDWRQERDGTQTLVVTLTEYTRAGWGEGGADFDWYCSSNTEAHVGSDPVYLSNAAEIAELIGPAAAEVLNGHCAALDAANLERRARHLPLFGAHPASSVAPSP